ncbi:DUF2922 domain-containing protein [Ectobacillus antri]|uniref:DUF2922 domain-containing protein n=1 Tax=Ectobacillus antri TaxID=2486280 RepID=A0ABT6H9C1_9BACI|nr:DUF2922 domain-containing protein [Ectobacillus antri]MDG4658568.1 DUF2922 domain-containing protein [Ectobacillus antri]MDG5755572.1 DUF2922 domain-containing protein [Ectobacillus antri]
MLTLELQFLKDDGKTATFSIDNPTLPIEETAVNAVMDTILNAGVFRTLGPNSRKKGARLVERTVTEYDLQ